MDTNTLYHKNQYFFKGILSIFIVIVCLTSRMASANVLDAGDYQTCGITKDDKIICWGNHADEPIPAIIAPFTQISVGLFYTCVINNVNQMNCWVNTNDPLNSETSSPPPIPVEHEKGVLQVSVGDDDICALTLNHDVTCWSYDSDSQTLTSASETGPFKQVSVGSAHTCALTEQGQAKCWGNNDSGQAPPEPVAGPFTQISAAGYHTCGLTEKGEMTCWGENSSNQTPASEVGPFVYINTGFSHTCAVMKDSGQIQCWGDDTFGEVSLPSQAGGSFDEVSVGFDHTCAVKADDSVSCWGDDLYNQTVVPVGLVLKVNAPTSGGSTPPAGGTDPGKSDSTPSTGSTDPGKSDSTPSTGSTDPGKSDSTPSTGGTVPGKSGSTPPTGGTVPGKSDSTPSTGSTVPGKSDSTPSTGSTVPGKSDSTPSTGSTVPTIVGSDPITIGELASCEPATYSNETRQATLPYVEIPLYTDIDGKSILSIGLFSAILEIPFGFSDIQVKELTFISTIEQTNPCHPQFKPENGVLTIPVLNVPTIVPYLKSTPIFGPIVQCDATLQQSILRPDVLSLTGFNCVLP
ncbi:hypothetical protein THII_3909 [Thioploca ingrica]|uniref:non-specific serine/threonine protein kinase n=1 Tax=Thioploca ingrica TaxID=40754 RepID=A0A090BW93_9GAMM|nr:hypothetical protein THII_3909 [Thioploca ingrica]